MSATIHLRLHGEKMWSLANRARPGGQRPSTYWRTAIVYGRRRGGLVIRRTVRVAIAACDRRLARLDETVRFSADKLPTCEHCLVIRDRLLERGLSKPLTTRRLTAALEATP